MTAKPELQRRFNDALRSAGGRHEGDAAFDRLYQAYQQPHRHYHTLHHIDSCLAWLDWTWAAADHPHEVLLALWYHDAVYDPLAHDNEAKSAAVARADLASVGVPDAVIARVEALIIATREHASGKGDAALLTDIDLSILGARPADFERFETDVRSEYASVDAMTYARGRAAVLKRLADRVPMYATETLQSELGARAGWNLSTAIERWERESLRTAK